MTKKILLADDSLTIQKVVELTFSDSDYELVCVSNGQKALDRLRDDRPDLVLADVVMPEKNGYEVCEAIKSNPATSRIPVMLLSGTFEPFDRERAERIGADAIVSKPFDSQQLIAQVEALLDRAPTSRESGPPAGETLEIPAVQAPAPEAPSPEPDEGPFDVGFSAEDFTAAVRIPPRGLDPFEEEYGRGDVDSAIEAFERSRPHPGTAEELSPARPAEPSLRSEEEAGREPLATWLRDEAEKPADAVPTPPVAQAAGGFEFGTEATVAIQIPLPPPGSADEQAEISEPAPSTSQAPPEGLNLGAADEGAGEHEAGVEVEAESPRVTLAPPADEDHAPPAETAPSGGVPHEIEMLAQTSSIPELTQMLSSVVRSAGADLTDEQIEKLARRVVEKLSDRVVREIAWEVIPDVAEIVIKRRIKELEAGIE